MKGNTNRYFVENKVLPSGGTFFVFKGEVKCVDKEG